MEDRKTPPKEKYSEPKVLASYKKDDLEAIIKPHAKTDQEAGGGCGCGCSVGCGGG